MLSEQRPQLSFEEMEGFGSTQPQNPELSTGEPAAEVLGGEDSGNKPPVTVKTISGREFRELELSCDLIDDIDAIIGTQDEVEKLKFGQIGAKKIIEGEQKTSQEADLGQQQAVGNIDQISQNLVRLASETEKARALIDKSPGETLTGSEKKVLTAIAIVAAGSKNPNPDHQLPADAKFKIEDDSASAEENPSLMHFDPEGNIVFSAKALESVSSVQELTGLIEDALNWSDNISDNTFSEDLDPNTELDASDPRSKLKEVLSGVEGATMRDLAILRQFKNNRNGFSLFKFVSFLEDWKQSDDKFQRFEIAEHTGLERGATMNAFIAGRQAIRPALENPEIEVSIPAEINGVSVFKEMIDKNRQLYNNILSALNEAGITIDDLDAFDFGDEIVELGDSGSDSGSGESNDESGGGSDTGDKKQGAGGSRVEKPTLGKVLSTLYQGPKEMAQAANSDFGDLNLAHAFVGKTPADV